MYKENYPSRLLEDAVDAISSLPGVGRRSALRLSLHLLREDPAAVHRFTDAINALRDKARRCKVCGMISDEDLCPICSDSRRDARTICVVENIQDVMSIENTGQYRGVYHVLGGIISPINGIGPADLNIAALKNRLEGMVGGAGICPCDGAGDGTELSGAGSESDGTGLGASGAGWDDAGLGVSGADTNLGEAGQVEVIMALPGDVEGDTTAFYIYRQIAGFGVKITTIARGLGFSDGIQYADSFTLGRSIAGRVPFKAE